MKIVKAAPGAKRLIESLRHLGYDCSAAIADLVDNSVAARASKVYVDIRAQFGSVPAAIIIADNGNGMDRENLQEAMRFGSFQEYSGEDLGKYGLGLKTASLSQCRVLTVGSKAKPSGGHRPRRSFARWDLDHIDDSNDWDLFLPSLDDLEEWESEALGHEVAEDCGTVVVWSGLEESLPYLYSHDVRFRERALAKLINDVGNHLRMVFHRFMQGLVPGRRRLRIYLNDAELAPWDPFCRDEDSHELEPAKFSVTLSRQAGNEAASQVTFSPFILPREDEFSSSSAWKAASGPRSWNQQQGFYFYRNDRLLQAGGWSWLRAVDEHTKLLRVAVLFPAELDRLFEINVTKMRAKIPTEIRERVGEAVSQWAKLARERYDRRPARGAGAASASRGAVAGIAPAKSLETASPSINVGPVSLSISNTPSKSLTVTSGSSPTGQIRVVVPHRHELAESLAQAGSEDSFRKLCLAAISLLEALYDRKLAPEAIPLKALKRAYSRLK